MTRNLHLLCWVTGMLLLMHTASAQSPTFFTDSNDEGYYDSGLAFPNGQSTLEQAGPSGDKIPTNDTLSYSGDNALKIKWTSRPGGDWSAIIIAPGFPFQDITVADYLSMWVYSEAALASADMPYVFLEGAPGVTKSNKLPLSAFQAGLAAQSWTQILIPLDTFYNDPNQSAIDFTQIKAVILGQNAADEVSHTLFVDEVRTFTEAEISAPVSTPVGFMATGYDSHIELAWTPNADIGTVGYHVFRSTDQGQTFALRNFVPVGDSLFLDWVGFGDTSVYTYQLAAVNGGGTESGPTPSVAAQTRALSEAEMLEMVQRYTFRYFYDFAHPISGLSRERNTSGNLVTIGGSGFGVMAILVGIERGYISRAEGKARLQKMVAFLETADRFHGAWPHWMNGTTGETIPFSTLDDGGDLVETSFMIQGLLTARQYFDQPGDSTLRADITQLWHEVEWNWYRRQVQKVLTWHWSPNFGWQLDLLVRGFNETHITYLLALASPTHGVPVDLYDEGWAGGTYENPGSRYGYPMIVGPDYGGPLFFAHYSYLGFDPRNKRDAYANYFERNYNHTQIHREYSIENPLNRTGYSSLVWGLTASDNPFGYLAHEPGNSTRDNGTVTPTAAIGSIPYAPDIVIPTIYHFYRTYGRDLWGTMGFRDAFNLQENWFANSYLAIDQGPILLMIENYRTGLLWENFMANPEIDPMMQAVGFVPDSTKVSIESLEGPGAHIRVFPNPLQDQLYILPSQTGKLHWELFDLKGKSLKQGSTTVVKAQQQLLFQRADLPAGLYTLALRLNGKQSFKKLSLHAK